MGYIKKVYGYIVRFREGKPEVLVFRHPIAEAGIQIPKGTVKPNESLLSAIVREIEEETGLLNIEVEKLLANDIWEYNDGTIHHRYFYRLNIVDAPDEWSYEPTGGGDEAGLTFQFFWISSVNEVQLVRGHGDYLDRILS